MAFLPFLSVYAVTALVDALGFIDFKYFVSLGYAFSIVADSVILFGMYRDTMSAFDAVYCIVLCFYGARLGNYLHIRGGTESYQKKMKDEYKDGTGMKLSTKISMWLGCALIYACEVSPLLFRFQNKVGTDINIILGLFLTVCGAVIEGLADHQKLMAKSAFPDKFVDSGLYMKVRCPNYFGEILVWTGVFISGLTAYQGFWQWTSAIFGFVCITFVMFAAARTLEIRQNKCYGKDEKYQDYCKKTPILIPGVQLYSLEKYSFLAC